MRPALTAEEWEQTQFIRGAPENVVIWHQTGDTVIPNGGFVLDLQRSGQNAQPTPETRHALAALALYDQPFGFTREDLETLDDAIYTIHGPKMDGLHPGVEQALDNLKERIEALLPREG